MISGTLRSASILLTVILAACNVQSQEQHLISSSFEEGKATAELKDKRLKEISGLDASGRHPNMYWVLNDSGNDPEVYLLDNNLNVRMTVRLKGVENRDWEDITVGPGPDPGKSYVYVGEIGDNEGVFADKHIYWFEEPELKGSEISISDFNTITFRLEDGVKDTESLFIDPGSKDLYIISKREDPVTLYRLTVQPGAEKLTAKKVMTLPQNKTVSADYSPQNGLVIKNYKTILWWEPKAGANLSAILQQQPVAIPYQEEPQGESIAWLNDGSGFHTISEIKKKKPIYLWYYKVRAK